MSASSLPARVPSITPSYPGGDDDDDDDDGAAYKMDSFGTMPRERPSRDHSLRPPSEPSSSSLTTVDSMKATAEMPPDRSGNDVDEESVHSLPLASLDSGHNKSDGSYSKQQQMQNSNVSLDINVEARTDEPLSRYDVYYASTDTFPTSNVFSQQAAGDVNRRDILKAQRMSIDTVPISNMQGDSESRLTAVMSVGETTTSDLTTTTFDTTNAVVPGVYEIDEGDETEQVRPADIRREIVEEDHDEEEDYSGVLMHSMDDEHDDIPLEELFANAQLNSTPMDMTSGNPQDENNHHTQDSIPQIMVEMDTNPALSRNTDNNSIDSRQQDHLVDLENPPTPNSAPGSSDSNTGTESNKKQTDGAMSSLSEPNSTTELEESREAGSGAAATDVTATAGAKTATKTQDDNPPIAESSKGHRSPPSEQTPYRLYICRAAVMALVLFVVVLSASLFYTRSDNTNGIGTTSAPTTSTPSVIIPTIPTASPVSTPSPSITTPTPELEAVAAFQGQANGSRLGTQVSLSSNGDFVAALSLDLDEPVRTFQRFRGSAGWLPFPSLPLTGGLALNASSSSLEAVVSLSAAATAEGFSAVAVSFASGFQVYEHRGVRWAERGQFVLWESSNTFEEQTIASSTAIKLSSDASQLAAGYVGANGRSVLVQNYDFDANTERWFRRGGTIRRDQIDNDPLVISLSLALSGDGSVLAVGDWTLGNPQVVVERFEWNGTEWSPMGPRLELPWGPVSMALSHSGYKFAQANAALGSAFEWDGGQWTILGNGFVGGSALSMSGDGSSIMVGDAVQGTATLLDYGDDDTWQTRSLLTGTRNSRFGESVSMSRDGTSLSIGSPLEDGDGSDVGQITLFE